jgi:uncharacterized protein YutE (UPF0331/DUF86 family)
MTEWQKFVVAMSQAWAWPIITGVSVYLLREAIKQLAARLRSAKYGDFQAEFGEELEKVEQRVIAEEALAGASPPTPASASEREGFNRALQFAPSAAILAAWQAVEAELISLARAYDISGHRVAQLVRQLLERQIIDEETYRLLDELRSLRNKVVHNAIAKVAVTRDQAERYGDLAFRVAALLRSKREEKLTR